MATATKKSLKPSTSADSSKRLAPPSFTSRLVGISNAVYRFLASLKLAVITLLALAASLAFATWLESRYGTPAAQYYVYQSTWFAILLAFLATNIFCAASIRFPWKRRQTGFVVTHTGLLILIFGSYFSFKTADEGMIAMLEGETRSQILRRQDSVIRLREIDPKTREPKTTYDMPFQPGPFAWGPSQAPLRTMAGLTLNALTNGALPRPDGAGELISEPGSPVKVTLKEFLPASTPASIHEADPSGVPMARMQLLFKAPTMPRAQEAYQDSHEQWFELDRRFSRVARTQVGDSQAPALVSFAYVDRPELVQDFLNPAMNAGARGLARFRYTDKAGKSQVFDLPLQGQEGKTVTLPESDLTVKVEKVADFPTSEGNLFQVVGEPLVPIGMFQVRKGDGPWVEHFAMGGLPMIPNVMPRRQEPDAPTPEALVSIHLMTLPDLDPQTNGRFGQIEVLAGPGESLSYRVFGRGKDGKPELRSSGPVVLEKETEAFGGQGSPMSIAFRVDEYLPAGSERQVYELLHLPKNQLEEAIPASLIEMTVGDSTREFWLQRGEAPEGPSYKTVMVGDRFFEIAYDIDRGPLNFDMKLDKFEVAFEPGTEKPTKFVSQVRLTDNSQGIKDQPHTISMNEPLSHRGFRFYQMRYSAMQDPRTGQRTGQFQSVLQVATDPGRSIKYLGCIVLVLGIFLQFYMKAGVFSGVGKKAGERTPPKEGSPEGRSDLASNNLPASPPIDELL